GGRTPGGRGPPRRARPPPPPGARPPPAVTRQPAPAPRVKQRLTRRARAVRADSGEPANEAPAARQRVQGGGQDRAMCGPDRVNTEGYTRGFRGTGPPLRCTFMSPGSARQAMTVLRIGWFSSRQSTSSRANGFANESGQNEADGLWRMIASRRAAVRSGSFFVPT